MKREMKAEPGDIIAEARKHLFAVDNALAALQLHERAKQAQIELARLDEEKKRSGGDLS
jgi:hypothetical protein